MYCFFFFFFCEQPNWNLTCGSASVLCAKLIFVLTVRSRRSCVGLELFPNGAFGCSTEPWDNFLKWYIWNNGYIMVGLDRFSCVRVILCRRLWYSGWWYTKWRAYSNGKQKIKKLGVKSHVYYKRRSFSLIQKWQF